MKFKYTISENEYARAAMLAARKTVRWRVILVLGIGCLLALGVFGDGMLQIIGFGCGFGGALGWYLRYRFVVPFWARRNYRKYKLIQEPMTVELLEDGLAFSAPDSSGLVRWSKILKWKQNDEFVLVYPMPRLYYIVPKKIGENGFDIDRMTGMLSETVGKEI